MTGPKDSPVGTKGSQVDPMGPQETQLNGLGPMPGPMLAGLAALAGWQGLLSSSAPAGLAGLEGLAGWAMLADWLNLYGYLHGKC